MANKKISELTALGGTPANDDVVPVVDASTSTTKKVTVSNLLASKADSSHTHAISDVTNLQTSLDAKQATVTAGDGLSFSGDTLNAEVTQTELDAKQDTVTAGDGLSFTGSTLNAEVTQAELDAKAASSHTHTLSDITDSGTAAPLNVASSGDAASGEVVKGDDSRLTDARTPSSHTHAISEVTNLQTSLDAKQATVTAGDGLSFSGSTLNAEVTQAELDAKIANVSEDTTPQLGGNLDVNGQDIVSTSNADVEIAPNGTGATVFKGNTNAGKITLNCENNSHGVSLASPAHADYSGSWTLTLPTSAGSNGQVLTTNGSGVASWAASSSVTDLNDLSDVNAGSPSDGQVLKWNDSASKWQAMADNNSGGGGGGGTPAGSTGQIQFNSGGSFGADSNLVWDDANDRLGVGTGSPSKPLHVVGEARFDGTSGAENVYINSGAADSDAYLWFMENGTSKVAAYHDASADALILKGDSSTDTLTVKGSNVGIGTTSPSQKLQITGSNDTDHLSILLNSSGDTSKAIYAVEGNTAGTLCTGTVARAAVMASTASGTALQLGTAGVIRATLDSSGNCGLGTSSPSEKLDVHGSIQLTGSTRHVSFNSDDAKIVANSGSGGFSFYNGGASGTERFRISSGGNVGIGTNGDADTKLEVESANPTIRVKANTDNWAALDIHAGDTQACYLFMRDSGGERARIVSTTNNDIKLLTGGGTVSGLTIDSSGNCGIGTAIPSYKFHVAGTAYAEFNQSLNGFGHNGNNLIDFDGSSNYCQITTNGSERLRIASDGALTSTSTSADAVFLKSSHANNTNVYITNTNATTSNTANLWFAPANDVSGAKISAIATEDFSTSANRSADLALSTRNNGNWVEAMRIDSDGTVDLKKKAIIRDDLDLYNDYCIQYWKKGNGTDTLGWILNRDDNSCQYMWADGQPLMFGTVTTGGSTTERMRILSNGRVQIGDNPSITTNSSNNSNILEAVSNGASVTSAIRIANKDNTTGSAQGAALDFGLVRSTNAFKPNAGKIIVGREQEWGLEDTDINAYMAFSVFGGNSLHERMRIDSSGHCGIGTTSPSDMLELSGSSPEIRLTDSDLTSTYSVLSGNGGHVSIQADPAGNTSGSRITMEVDGTERMRIDSSGASYFYGQLNVAGGSGTTTNRLNISYNASNGVAEIAPDSNSGHTELKFSTCLSGTKSEAMRVDNTGRVTVKKSSNAEVTALTDASTITPDFDDANNFSVTLGGNRTLANPSNCTAGQSGIITITQDGTGSRTLAYGSYWKFSGGTAPTLTTTASAVDVLAYYVESATRITATLITDTK